MPQNYTPEFKKKIVRLHEEEGRTNKSVTAVMYPKPAFPSGVANLAKNVRQAPRPKKIMIS